MYNILLDTRWFLALNSFTIYKTVDTKNCKIDIHRRPSLFRHRGCQTEPSMAPKLHPLVVHALNDEYLTIISHRQ